ncbi:hypothetical protein KC867_03620, partial [Candidatus Saccharibacteria bacterium]|nr:hypothetical protein [Candidatus Saccharibacteria bacterium]
MNGYNNYHKSPEAGQAVPPSIQRRLRVTDMALRFAVAATYMQHSAEQARLQRETEARPAVGKIGVSQIINNNAEPVHVESVTTPTPATETPAPTINNVPKTTPVAIE